LLFCCSTTRFKKLRTLFDWGTFDGRGTTDVGAIAEGGDDDGGGNAAAGVDFGPVKAVDVTVDPR
jgi:hypothetical protein